MSSSRLIVLTTGRVSSTAEVVFIMGWKVLCQLIDTSVANCAADTHVHDLLDFASDFLPRRASQFPSVGGLSG